MTMSRIGRASVAVLLHDLDRRSPAGCAIGLHIRFSTPRYMFQSYPKRWMDTYAGAGLFAQDPTVRWGMNNVGWIRWGELEGIDSQGVLDLAKDHGIMNGVTIALLVGGSRSIASFARSDRDYEGLEIDELEIAFEQLHRATASIESLTDEDRLALKDLSVRLTH
jgi:LuxR family transcriptional regulator, quorum-sensing system regulator SdiA